ncbi:MAG: ATP12 family protein [Pseudomonadota bacterium]
MTLLRQKRFWKQVTVPAMPGGFGVALDGRPVKTPAKAPLVIPTEAAAQIVAQEWDAQQDAIDPALMPATRWANSAIDKVAPQQDAVAGMLADYGASDLLCYRADGPSGLVDAQAAAWDPPLAWCRDALGADLQVTEGIVPVAQAPDALAHMRRVLDRLDSFELAAVHDLIVISGSLVLGLMVEADAINPAEAWRASRVDEDWQIAQWGDDAEAIALAQAKEQDFHRAAGLLNALRQGR